MSYYLLFIWSFLSASIVPIASEPYFLTCIYLNNNILPIIIVASVGNSLGGIFTYYLGYYGRFFWQKRKPEQEKSKTFIRAEKLTQKYGAYTLFFSWVPFIGDALVLASGIMKTNKTLSFTCMIIGKTLRYVALAYFLI